MKKKSLGNTDLNIPPIIFGGNVFGWTLNEQESSKMLDMVVDAGFNTIDTSNSYPHWAECNSGGESETIIGNWLKKRANRDQVNIITKVGSAMGGEHPNLSEDYILEQANLVAYVASPLSSATNGDALRVDGGAANSII